MSLDADDLLVFARVIESGSFSRATERLQLPKRRQELAAE